MAVVDVTEKTFVDEVLMADGLVVVDYWADWCSPCKQMAPIIDELAGEFGDVAGAHEPPDQRRPLIGILAHGLTLLSHLGEHIGAQELFHHQHECDRGDEQQERGDRNGQTDGGRIW